MHIRRISFLVSSFSEEHLVKSLNNLKKSAYGTNNSMTFCIPHKNTLSPSQIIFKGSQFMYSTTSSEQNSKNVYISLNTLKNEIRKDIADNFKNYSQIRKSFIHYVEQKSYHSKNQDQLIDILDCISQYPFFILPNSTVLQIYKIICQNMHLKSVQTMNKLLIFILIADQNSSQSPIFAEFIKFYVRNNLEVLKYTYQIDFSKLSLYEGIKQFLGKLMYRGFLSRTPSYDRGLSIIYPQKILSLLVSKHILRDSLMVKKINYFFFIQIKAYYEQNMKQNLYHRNKLFLIRKFNRDIIKFLSYQIQSTHHQAIFMRQIYMKLYLTLPNRNQTQNSLQVDKQYKQQEQYLIQCEKCKYKNVIYLYNLSTQHIQRLDHLKIQEIDERIEIVIQFVQQVSVNLKKLLKMSQQELLSISLSTEEILMIIKVEAIKNQDIKSYSTLQKIVEKQLSPYLFWVHFQLFMDLLNSFKENSIFDKILIQYEYFYYLSLDQIQILSQKLNPYLLEEKYRSLQIIWENLLKRILSIDYQIIGGKEMIKFLECYSKLIQIINNPSFVSNISKNDQITHLSQTLRFFMMRYISDHHKQFSLRQFQLILQLLIELPSQRWSNFDDKDGNYPKSIFEELRAYFNKVKLLIDSDIRCKLQLIY